LQIRLPLRPSGQPAKLLRVDLRDCKLRRGPINFINAYAPPVGIKQETPDVLSKIAESIDQETLLVLLRVKMDNDGSHGLTKCWVSLKSPDFTVKITPSNS
jgi:hypothetical protein